MKEYAMGDKLNQVVSKPRQDSIEYQLNEDPLFDCQETVSKKRGATGRKPIERWDSGIHSRDLASYSLPMSGRS